METDKYFAGNWLKAEDLKGNTVEAIIESSKEEVIGENNDKKLVVYLVGFDKGLVLNKTNWEKLKESWGSESDNWKNKKIRLCTKMVPYKDKEVPAIRIEIPEGAPVGVPAATTSKVETDNKTYIDDVYQRRLNA
jgi:hypothetical protein